jgi:hypothetical protein
VHHPWNAWPGVVFVNHQIWEIRKMPKQRRVVSLLLTAAAACMATACDREPEISFSQDVQPVLEANCLSCHQAGGAGYEASGFSMVSYEDLMKGTDAGPMVIAGDVEGSNLLVLMEGRADPSISMPHGSMNPVPGREITLIKQWIAQGAKNN